MQFEHIESLPGSPPPADLFEPHMPGVDLLSDMDGFFRQARELLEAENPEEQIQRASLGVFAPPEGAGKGIPKGQR